IALIKTNKHTIDAIIDRVVVPEDATDKEELQRRLADPVETGLKLGNGSVIVAEVLDSGFDFPASPTKMTDHLYSEKFACPVDNISLPDIEPRLFSFNSPHGACSTCTGLGTILEVEPTLVLNPNLTINEGGILPWSRMANADTWHNRIIQSLSEEHGFSLDAPIKDLSEDV